MNDIRKENDLNRPFIIFSRKLAGYMLYNGADLIRTRPDAQDLTKNVYIFKNSPDIETLIEDYNEQLSLE